MDLKIPTKVVEYNRQTQQNFLVFPRCSFFGFFCSPRFQNTSAAYTTIIHMPNVAEVYRIGMIFLCVFDVMMCR